MSEEEKYLTDNFSRQNVTSEIGSGNASSSILGPAHEERGLGNLFQMLNQVNGDLQKWRHFWHLKA